MEQENTTSTGAVRQVRREGGFVEPIQLRERVVVSAQDLQARGAGQPRATSATIR